MDTQLEAVNALSERLAGELSVEAIGFEQFSDLTDPRQRAVVSDLLVASVDGIEVNLREASEHARLLADLAGPNGRAMPDPTRPQEEEEMQAMDRELAGFLRAVGSSLDCLAAATIAALRLPMSIRRASAEALMTLRRRAEDAEGDQAHCWSRTAVAFEEARDLGGNAWLQWMLEMRNAVIHRARQLRIWLPRPSTPRPPSARLIVPGGLPPARLIRYELHLRRKPWLADMDSLSGAAEARDNWLAEPATSTVRGIMERLLPLIESVIASILVTWEETAEHQRALPAPADQWSLETPSQRAREAATFEGFEPDYPVPPLNAIVTSPREATRAAIAEVLRQEGLDLNEVE